MKKVRHQSNYGAMGAGAFFTNSLQIAFIVLKLCNVIDWSLWWVFSPVWGTALLVLLVFIALATFEACKILWRRKHGKKGD